ncbi:MAG: hypothetical protein H6670_03630 [Anaerolineaceae bacterium]|nr:hypothetical protein [Anaerolineaceae bacterium]
MFAKDHMPVPQATQVKRTIPLTAPSPYAPQAEQALQTAFAAYQRGDWGDALLLLGDAVNADGRLQNDELALQLAHTITGESGQVVLARIGFAEQRWQYIEALQPSAHSFTDNLRTAAAFVFSMVLALGLIYAVANWLPNVTDMFADPLDKIEIDTRTLTNGVEYDVYVPPNGFSGPGWPMLVLLGDDDLHGDDLLAHFLVTNAEQVVYVIPHLPLQPAEVNLPIVHEIITQTENAYPTALDSVILFGYGDGGALASLYANQYPQVVAATITSGATWIYPQAAGSGPMLVLLGSEDPLYITSDQGANLPFIDQSEWPNGLQYLVMENVGHEINAYQVDAALQLISEIHANAVE